jgi:simple sugar transport system substrate-binding protein
VTASRALAGAVLGACLLVTTACDSRGETGVGTTTVTVATRAPRSAAPPQPLRNVRIVVVTHGEASDPFWAIVKEGVDQAARDLGVSVSYRSPDAFSPTRMATLIGDAVATRPDGLVVSIPDTAMVGAAVAHAAAAGIPIVAINSGEDVYRRLGALLFVGQPEYAAGFGAGRRMAALGVREAVCVNHQRGVASLGARCRGFSAALARAGGRAHVVTVDVQDQPEAERRIGAAASAAGVDGVLALGPAGATPSLLALRQNHLLGRVKFATFDLAPDILVGIRKREVQFAVDQQPFLQGYLPVVLLTQRRLYGLAPASGTVIPTGPSFVTRSNVARVQELTEAGIR